MRVGPSKTARAVQNTALLLLALIWITPVLWMINTGFKQSRYIFTLPPRWIAPLTLDHFAKVLDGWPFFSWLNNSFIVSAAATLISIILAIFAAYAFARLRWKGRDVVFVIFLASMLIPWQVNAVPLYFIMNSLGLLNTRTSVVLPIIAMPISVFLLRQFFINIPREMDDAAMIDGCGPLGIIFRVIVPMSIPAISALGIYMFIFAWNEFFWSTITLVRKEMFTIPLGLRALQGAYDIDYGLLMAGATLASAPVLIVYLLLRKWLISGITMSGAGLK